MRYADGPTAEVDTIVAAPIEAVWLLVTDIELPARFSTEFKGARWLDAPPAVGARFQGRNEHPAIGAWETTCHVTRFEPPRAFAWSVGDPSFPAAHWWWDLEEEPTDVRVRYRARIGPAPSGLTAAITAMPDLEERIVDYRLADFTRNMTATLAGIKALAEAAP